MSVSATGDPELDRVVPIAAALSKRGLPVLRMIASSGEPVRYQDIAAATSLTRSSIYTVIAQFEELGVVVVDRSRPRAVTYQVDRDELSAQLEALRAYATGAGRVTLADVLREIPLS